MSIVSCIYIMCGAVVLLAAAAVLGSRQSTALPVPAAAVVNNNGTLTAAKDEGGENYAWLDPSSVTVAAFFLFFLLALGTLIVALVKCCW